MKKLLTSAVVMFCIAGVSRGNILSNASFEVAGSSQNTAQYWEWGYPDTHGGMWGSASRESWRAHSGTWEGTIRGSWSGVDYGGWWQEKPAIGGATYTLSVWLWADASWTNQQDQGIKIEFFAGGEMIDAVTNAFGGIGEQWVQKTVTGVAPTNAEWVRAVVYASGVGSQGALQFDDVSLVSEPGTVIVISGLPLWMALAACGLVGLHRLKVRLGCSRRR